MLQSLTPILSVDSIESSLPFWLDELGFEKIMEVPHGGGLGFVMLKKDACEVMLQTHGSIRDDAPAAVADLICDQVGLVYLKVDDVDELMKRVDGDRVVIPRRETFYGATEVGVREPGGHVVLLASYAAQ